MRSIKTVRATVTMTVAGPDGPVDLPAITSIRYPGAFRVEAETPAGPLVQVFNSGSFWVRDRQRGVYEPPQKFADDMRANVQRDALRLLLGLADGRVPARRVADLDSGGRTFQALEVGGDGMRPLTLLFEPSTALVRMMRYTTETGPAPEPTEEEFSDYRNVDGIQVPFTTVVRRSGQQVLRRVVNSVEFNVPLDPALFTKPS
jgi:hypothetical protein